MPLRRTRPTTGGRGRLRRIALRRRGFREHDPQYLAKLVADFRKIQAHLPDPVPAGVDKKTYFTENYQDTWAGPDGVRVVSAADGGLLVYDEPARSFQQVLDTLPKNRYE